MTNTETARVLGVFAGGRGTRMGGRDKAELRAPGTDESLLERGLRLGRELGFDALVIGGRERAGLLVIEDRPHGIGPLGGLAGLLAYAGERPALALACDMPYVEAALLARLAFAATTAAVLAPRDPASGKWQPLFARYDSARVRPVLERAIASGTRSFQRLFRALPVEAFALSPAELASLRDWDEPGDLR